MPSRHLIPLWLRHILIILSVGGGFAGLTITLQALLGPQMRDAASRVIAGCACALYLFVLIAGLIFVQSPSRLTPLAIAYCLQTPMISSSLIACRFSAGASLYLGVGANGLTWTAQLGAEWQFYLLRAIPFILGINVIALAISLTLLVVILRNTARTRREHEQAWMAAMQTSHAGPPETQNQPL